jgi:hypothetical protein
MGTNETSSASDDYFFIFYYHIFAIFLVSSLLNDAFLAGC